MFTKREIPNLVVIDIETTTKYETIGEFEKNEPGLYQGFLSKAQWYLKNDTDYKDDTKSDDFLLQQIYEEKMPLFPEFSKIICITVGGFALEDQFLTKSFYDDSESDLLLNFMNWFHKKILKTPALIMTGYNIMSFDIPFIIKRCIVNSIEIDGFFKIFDKKPWDLSAKYKDIFLLWKLGSSNYVSLDVVANTLGIQTHKNDMDGSKVYSVYYNEDNGLEKIKNYCEDDVKLTGKVIMRVVM